MGNNICLDVTLLDRLNQQISITIFLYCTAADQKAIELNNVGQSNFVKGYEKKRLRCFFMSVQS